MTTLPTSWGSSRYSLRTRFALRSSIVLAVVGAPSFLAIEERNRFVS